MTTYIFKLEVCHDSCNFAKQADETRLIIDLKAMVTASSIQLQCKTANRLAQMATPFSPTAPVEKDVLTTEKICRLCMVVGRVKNPLYTMPYLSRCALRGGKLYRMRTSIESSKKISK